ncbi:MAG TPA: mycothiol synthase [Mycobacteriales bacterium]|nr:mycothiol synthase [Mycobacteriales bacterium]
MAIADADVRIEMRLRLEPSVVAETLALLEAAAEADGVVPLSEHAWLHLRHGGDTDARNVLVRRGDVLAGYAHLDPTDRFEGSSGEVVVHPAHREQGIGRALVEQLVSLSPDGRLRLWAHGTHPGAQRLATSMGFERFRVLCQMRRSLLAPLPAAPLPSGVTVRTFEVGRDEDAWIETNNRAFADHPDQSGWTVDDLLVREGEAWFDPAGFFLAERDGRLAGFHWTKVHGGSHVHEHDGSAHAHEHDHSEVGEVYVVGVDPSAQGVGLGPALTRIGLAHLRQRGVSQAMLYVDESNTNAIKVYERLGFTRWATDVSFRRRASSAPESSGKNDSARPGR